MYSIRQGNPARATETFRTGPLPCPEYTQCRNRNANPEWIQRKYGKMAFIALIDYEMGNLLSVSKALEFTGAEVRIVKAPAEAEKASGVLLPGVGSFGDGMFHLNRSGFTEFVKDWIAADKPFLGICLGMQMLMESSEEAPGVPGLGIFRGTVRRFPSGKEKVPHIGWNSVHLHGDARVLEGISDGAYFYFVHSYYVKADDPSLTAAETDYILPFTSAIVRGNTAATQFHPEKSQDAGLRLFKNFVTLSTGGA